MHLENAVNVFQEVVSLVQGESETGQGLMTLLRNFLLLSAGWRNASLFSDSCSSVAIQSLNATPVAHIGKVGWVKVEITEETLLQIQRLGFTWTQVTEMLLVSHWTIRRRVVTLGLQGIARYSHISDKDLDTKVCQFMQQHRTLV